MRIMITGATEPSGLAVARMLTAAGHDVIGFARPGRSTTDPGIPLLTGDFADPADCARAMAGCVSVLHLADRGLAAVAAAARKSGVRVVVPVVAGARVAGRTESGVSALLRGVDGLMLRIPAVAGRRVGRETWRALEPLLGPDTAEGFQLLHTDDLERFLVSAAASQRTGIVELTAPGLVTPTEVRKLLRRAGIRYSAWVPGWSGRAPLLDPTAAQRDWGFRYGWSAREVVEDLVRGLLGRKPDCRGFHARLGAIPMPVRGVPGSLSAVPRAGGHGTAGEFADHHSSAAAHHTRYATLPESPTPLTADLHLGALRLADEAVATLLGPAATAFKGVARLWIVAHRYRASVARIDAAARAEALGADDIRALTDAQLHVRALLSRDRLAQAWQAVAVGDVLIRWAGLDDDVSDPAKSLPAVARLAQQCRADIALHAIARRGDVRAARTAWPAFDSVIDEIAHRGPDEYELLEPTFGDRPDLLLTAAAESASHTACLPNMQSGIECIIADDAIADVGRPGGRRYVADRDLSRDALARITHCLRLLVRERAARLVRSGRLVDPDDACYLTFDELFCPPRDYAERIVSRRTAVSAPGAQTIGRAKEPRTAFGRADRP
ncbi:MULTISPECIES: hypothetical protein [unclassified Nocardia]|uniref:hypothetical protein n=1 Tax=unclassified Nocardia TaxID=2637762 RepID=UPI001CE4A292|nr:MULTISPECIES: hypothetical protein [unclassified Nocardia]